MAAPIRSIYLAWAAAELRKKIAGKFNQSPHGLPSELIVSLTSYPPRFDSLHLTLLSLLTQNTKADRTILWVAEEDYSKLPQEVLDLVSSGLEIRTCKDTASYKKIIPCLAIFPDAFIVTADDDVYYPPKWLTSLCDRYDTDNKRIICHRAHRITFDQHGQPKPYHLWQHKVKGPQQGAILFATGAGGVLYPPKCFAEDVLREDIFMKVCPRADDVWLYWMATLNGCTYFVTDFGAEVTNWDGSQEVSLLHENITSGGNDRQIANMIAQYGLPPALQEALKA